MYARPMKNKVEADSKESSNKFKHKKSLGQNFLTSDIVPNWMVEAASVEAKDTILEIGPGTGVLTKAILNKGAKVIALEADLRAIEYLHKNFTEDIESNKLIIHHNDVRELDLRGLSLKAGQFKVVANIPYYLSGFLLRTLLESKIQPSSLTFLIQKELANRIVRDKKESLLSLSVKAFGQPRYQKTVTKGHFFPMPKVDSAIITVANINMDNFKDFSSTFFFEILHLGLGKKRKQLLTNLTEKHNRLSLEKIFNQLPLSLKIRGEDVSLNQWLKLTLLLAKDLGK